MVKIYLHLVKLTDPCKFEQRAMRVVEYEVRMHRCQYLYVSIDQAPTKPPDEVQGRPKQFVEWRDLPSEEVEEREARDGCQGAGRTARLLPRGFLRREMQQIDQAETMEVPEISESAVKTRLHRARLMLRETLTPFFAKSRGSLWAR
ncbi:MAG TPA: hypothetical protein VND66_14720 [Acidobacteriaceae bacterium]|nr:hypothetical protein [Acidobacteriaceae bacterium]